MLLLSGSPLAHIGINAQEIRSHTNPQQTTFWQSVCVNFIWNSRRENEHCYISLGFLPGGVLTTHGVFGIL
jgi:hypothetical protein